MFRSGFARCPLDGEPLQQIVDDPLSGATFADRYVIEECVGEGGMGRVYRARHQRVSRQFAIKVLFGEHAAEQNMRDRFAREAEAACRLSHPHVVSVLDFGETEHGLSYLVMDWVEGSDLSDVITEQAPFDAERVAELTRQLCQGLGHAHDKGLIHRDFKGENVIITHEGEREVARIVDFGIAVILEGDDSGRLTTEGIVIGTPAYMSPEQATGAELDTRADLFSLGVLMYEMMAGVLPFEGSPIAIARQNLAADPPPIEQRVPGLEVDPHLEAISFRLMQKRPEDRYATAADVLEALDAIGGATRRAVSTPGPDESAEATALEPADEQPLVPARRSRRGVLAAVLAILLLGGGAAFFALSGDSGEAPAAADDGAPDAGTAVATTPADAAPVAAVIDPAPDAGSVAVARSGKRTPHGRRSTARRPPKPPGDTRSPADAAPSRTEAPKTITVDSLQTLYVSVGKLIERLERERGTEAARAHRDEYFRIPFADALRTPALRGEVAATLRKLRRRVKQKLDSKAP